MNYFNLSKMSKEDLIEHISKLSRSYVPNWHMNLQDPDLGSALALIFSDMYSDLIDKARRLPDKHQIDFLNLLSPVQKSAKGASGYVKLTLSEGTIQPVAMGKAKQLLGVNEQGENLLFETQEEVLISPSKLERIYVVNSAHDVICPVYMASENPEMAPFFMPLEKEEPNLQRHELHLEEPHVLTIKTAEYIDIYLKDDENDIRRQAAIQTLSCENTTQWLYKKGGTWVQFDKIQALSNGIRLLSEGPTALESPEIKMVLQTAKHLQCESLMIRPQSTAISPDALYNNEIQLADTESLIFGSQFYNYDALYIASRENFTKIGAQVTLSFDFICLPCPTPYDIPEPNIKWKNVLRKADVPEVKEKPIIISEVLFEYWNGIGWASLKAAHFNRDMFKNIQEGVNHVDLEFICPNDFMPTTVGAFENYWVRLRIAGVENAYAALGMYQAPKLKRMKIRYDYNAVGVVPSAICCREFLEERHLDLETSPLTLFEAYDDLEGEAIYFKFDKPLVGGPLRLLFDVGSADQHEKPKYEWELLKSSAGSIKWRTFDVLDETKNFEETGLLSFIGDTDHAKVKLFGSEGYWLRAKLLHRGRLPVLIEGVHMNSVQITQMETLANQYFSLRAHEYNQQFKLNDQHLEKMVVWVNEVGMDKEALENLENPYELKMSPDGVIEEIWVKWDAYDNISQMSETTRGYVANLFEGTIAFGDTVHGKLVDNQVPENIKVIYSLSKGLQGNVRSGSVQSLAQSVPYVNAITNPLDLKGGKAPESRSDALIRTAKTLRHRGRALAIEDFNDLILAVDYDVCEVKTLSGMDSQGNPAAGYVTSAVLTKNIYTNQDYFKHLRDKIYKEMSPKLPCTLMPEYNFFVVEPLVVTVDVHFKGRIEEMNQYSSIQETLISEIDHYLDTYSGGMNEMGWEIGELPSEQDLLSGLQMIVGIKAIDHLVMSMSIYEDYQVREVSIEHLRKNPFVIIKNGHHVITLNL